MITPSSLVDDPDFARLKRYVLDQTGLEYFEHREQDLAERIKRCMNARGFQHVGEYLSLVQRSNAGGRTERDALIDAVTIGETYFFRFPEQFDALREQVLPNILRQNQARKTLNIWCAGCSSGAEPHTISIILRRDFGDLLRDWQVLVLGTDINERSLEQARSAWYASWAMRTLDEEERKVLFDRDSQTTRYVLKSGYRHWVRFVQQNLIHDPPPIPEQGAWDVIFCRNVLIYFDADTIARMITRFADSLAPGGYLFLGHAEPGPVPHMGKLFETVRYPGVILYRRRHPGETPSEYQTVYQPTAQGPVYIPPVFQLSSLEQVPWSPPDLSDINRRGALPQPAVEESIPPPRNDPAAIRTEIRSLLDRDQAKTVLERLSPILSANSTFPQLRHDPVLHYYQALALEHLEQWEEADAAISRALYLDRSFLLAHYQNALLAERRNDTTGALRSLDTLLKLLETGDESSKHRQLLQVVSDLTASEMAEIARLKRDALARFLANKP